MAVLTRICRVMPQAVLLLGHELQVVGVAAQSGLAGVMKLGSLWDRIIHEKSPHGDMDGNTPNSAGTIP